MNTTNAAKSFNEIDRYARCIQASKRVRWDIDGDVIRDRSFAAADKMLLDGLCRPEAFPVLVWPQA